jgi:hypothetical protein
MSRGNAHKPKKNFALRRAGVPPAPGGRPRPAVGPSAIRHRGLVPESTSRSHFQVSFVRPPQPTVGRGCSPRQPPGSSRRAVGFTEGAARINTRSHSAHLVSHRAPTPGTARSSREPPGSPKEPLGSNTRSRLTHRGSRAAHRRSRPIPYREHPDSPREPPGSNTRSRLTHRGAARLTTGAALTHSALWRASTVSSYDQMRLHAGRR